VLLSSRFSHGVDAKRLGTLVEAATEEWNRTIRAGGDAGVAQTVFQLNPFGSPRLPSIHTAPTLVANDTLVCLYMYLHIITHTLSFCSARVARVHCDTPL
jgi:hypothetical protein